MDLALYGGVRNTPRRYVRWRGLRWLRSGFCPCCYSSPPLSECPICFGNGAYGPSLTDANRAAWRERWERRAA